MMASSLKGYGSVEIYFDQILGAGRYGKVCKAKCGQLPCAAKVLHDTIFKLEEPGTDIIQFEQEFQLLSFIKHPNIIQYLGVIEDPTSRKPVLLMEILNENLTSYLKRSISPLPYHSQVDICHDVALALAHLHSNSIIHRNLSSNNVLLIGAGSRAKVADFGMYKLNPDESSLNQSQENTAYMPPEVRLTPPNYSSKMDCFSHGVLTIQIITRNYPKPEDADKHNIKDNDESPTKHTIPIPEVERRKNDIDQIERDLPLLPIAMDSLKDNDADRLSSNELCKRLALLKEESRYTNSSEKIEDPVAVIRDLKVKLEAKEQQVNKCQIEIQTKMEEHKKEIEELRKELEKREQLLKESHHQISEYQIKVKKVSNGAIQEHDPNRTLEPVVEKQDKDIFDPTSLTWTKGEPAPEAMGALTGVAIVHENTAYFSRYYSIYTYQLSDNKWSKLVSSQYQSFALAVIDNRLTTMGGINKDKKRTNNLFSLIGSRSGKKWKVFYPSMPTPRVGAVAIVTPTHLIVAGGRNRAELRTIEVMDRRTFQWISTNTLPEPIGYPQLTLCNGGYLNICKHQVLYSCSVEDFLHSCQQPTTAANADSLWTKLAPVPIYTGFSLISLGARILAIGGQDKVDNSQGTIYCYDRATDTWSVIGEIPTPRVDALTAVLPGNELVVVGGWSEVGIYNITEIGK